MTIRPIDRMTDDELVTWVRQTCIETGIAVPDPLIVIGIASALRAQHARHLSVTNEVDRLMALLDVAVDGVRKGNGDTALMAMQEALETAKRLQKKAIS